jgi:hypothetical protein
MEGLGDKMSWKPEVFADGSWSGNGLAFATKEESDLWGRDLLMRWFVPTDSRSVESDEPVNYEISLETGEMRPVKNG